MENIESNELDLLNERKKKLKALNNHVIDLKRTLTNFAVIITGLAPILIILTLFLSYKLESEVESIQINVILLVVYMSTCLGGWLKINTYSREAEERKQDIELEIELYQYKASDIAKRAERLVRINELQLRRYYDLNLRQNVWIFTLGTVCIALGIVVIIATLYFILSKAQSLDTKVISAVVGSIGSLLTTYVATIYLKMHADASTNLASFHSRLVETHQLLLGNLLASMIEDNEKRWKALSDLSLNISHLHSK